MYGYPILLTVCSTGGLQCWRTLFDNFAVHGVGLDGHHEGILQSVRQIPGFLALIVIFIAYATVESRWVAGSCGWWITGTLFWPVRP